MMTAVPDRPGRSESRPPEQRIPRDHRRRADPIAAPIAARRQARPPRETMQNSVFACVGAEPRGRHMVAAHAAALARSLDVPLAIGQVLEAEAGVGEAADPVAWLVAQRQCHGALDQLAARHDAGAVVLTGLVADRLAGWAADNRVGVVAMGVRHGAEGFGLGGVARRLLERCGASLLLVPLDADAAADADAGAVAGDVPDGDLPDYGRILVPLDGSQRAEAVLPLVVRIAHAHARRVVAGQAAHPPEILLVHVTPEVPVIGEADDRVRALAAELDAHNMACASSALEGLRQQLVNAGLAARVIVESGRDARRHIRALMAALKADLVILSAHGQGGVEPACGSVANYLANHATRPTLIVRHDLHRQLPADPSR